MHAFASVRVHARYNCVRVGVHTRYVCTSESVYSLPIQWRAETIEVKKCAIQNQKITDTVGHPTQR